MIRVLHVFGIMNNGGAQKFILDTYRKINRKDIQFDFLCMSKEEGVYDKEILSLGGRIFKIDPPSKIGYKSHIKEIRKILKETGPYTAIHITTQFHSGVVCLAAYLEKVPIRIVHSHSAGIKDKSIKRILYSLFGRTLINLFSTDKIACGEKARNLLFGKSKKERKEVLILPNGIDIDKYIDIMKTERNELRKTMGISDETVIIGNVGRFVEIKNHEFFIRLAKYYKVNKIKVKIVLVGDGELKEHIEKLINEENLNEYFILTGIRSDIPLLMNAFDVFVMPSFYEGFPVTIIEAIASGKNCVVSDNISREVEIIDESIVFLPLKEKIETWGKKIIEQANIVNDKEERRQILIEKGFSSDSTVKILTDLYKKEETYEKQ